MLNDLLGDGRSISLTWQRIVGGFILILIGILLTFRGYRHYRFTMFLAGFITGCKYSLVYFLTLKVLTVKRGDGERRTRFAEMENNVRAFFVSFTNQINSPYAANRLSLSLFFYSIRK